MGAWGYPLGDMHMVAIGNESPMVGTGWPKTNSCPGCMDKHKKHYSHLVGGLISGREVCLGSERVFDNQEC